MTRGYVRCTSRKAEAACQNSTQDWVLAIHDAEKEENTNKILGTSASSAEKVIAGKVYGLY